MGTRRSRAVLYALLLALGAGPVAPAAAGPATEPAADVGLRELLALPAPLRQAWRAVLAQRGGARRARLDHLVRFVFDPAALGMRYREDANHGVAESWATREANCLGFTLLFLALAREAGLEAGAQEYRQTLSWRRDDQTVFRSSHINAWVRVAGERYTFDVTPDAFLARRRAHRLSETELLAHWHNNRAIAHLARGELEKAARGVETALRLDPQRAGHWSNAGVVRLRRGDAAGAERAYAQALRLEPDHLDALFNRVSLAERAGDAAAAAAWRARLDRAQQRDPFHHFLLALDCERAGDLGCAIAHYRRAIRLHRDEARFHAALAQAYRRAGDARRARREAARAAELEAARMPRTRRPDRG